MDKKLHTIVKYLLCNNNFEIQLVSTTIHRENEAENPSEPSNITSYQDQQQSISNSLYTYGAG